MTKRMSREVDDGVAQHLRLASATLLCWPFAELDRFVALFDGLGRQSKKRTESGLGETARCR